jgi:phosphoribosylformylglycinamidine synthase
MGMHFLHEGIPMPTRGASWSPPAVPAARPPRGRPHVKDALFELLAHPNIASKQWIIRQYDHEVRGNTVLKPLVGPDQRGPGDAAVIEPIAGTRRGIAIGCGLQTPLGDRALGGDPYVMALAAIDECVRNVVCVGADPDRTAILDNFCWPSCGKPENLGTLVRACEGCYDGAKAYRTPFVSGKDSLNNQLKYVDTATGQERVIEIPPTLLITGMGIVPDVSRAVSSDAKRAGNVLLLVGATHAAMGGAMVRTLGYDVGEARIPAVDLALGPAAARLVARFISGGHVLAAHDCSEGGLLVAISEMLIGGCTAGKPLGARIMLSEVDETDPLVAAFSETPSRYVLEVNPADVPVLIRDAHAAGLHALVIAEINDSGLLTDPDQRLSAVVGDLAGVWMNGCAQ